MMINRSLFNKLSDNIESMLYFIIFYQMETATTTGLIIDLLQRIGYAKVQEVLLAERIYHKYIFHAVLIIR